MVRSIRRAERSMSKTYLPYDPDQQLLLPAALQEWLPEDHLAYFISDVVDQLDLSAITARYEQERRGGPPYHPRMMVKALLYGYCTGVASSRRMAQRLHEDIAFRVLAANNTPDFRTVSDFRKDHLEALADLFLQVLELCQQAGLVKLGHVALDGTKVRANASKHKAMSYGRMKEKEAQLQAEVDELLRKAQEVDEEEDRRYGKDRRGDELPEELAFREGRLRKIREAKAALEAGALAEAEQAESEGRNHPGVPDDKAQRNFTDPDSRIMPGPGADKGMYFIWDFTQLNVRPHSRVGLLKYKTAPICSLSGPLRHSGVGRNPGAVGPVRSYNLNFTYPCQRPGREGLPAVLQLSGGGGQRPPGNCGGPGHQPALGQGSGREHD